SKESGELFAAPRPQAINRDATGNITLATAKMLEIKGDTFSIGGVNYSLSRSPTGSVLAIRSDTGERFVYFYSPQDQSTRPNASFYFSEIRGVWLRNAEFTDSEGNQVRLFPNSLYTTFATTERKYALRAETVFSAGRAIQETVVYNRQTGRKLVEEGGFFYDVDENGNDITVEGYISDVGFWNFVRMFRDPKISKPFFQVFGWTFTWAGLSVFFSFTIGLALAMTLNDRRLKGKKIYRTLMIIPWAVPAFISALVWRNGFFNETYGVLNRFIVQGLFGLEPIKWLNDAFWAKVSVLIVNTWLGFPYMMTVSLGALQSIPEEFYEASSIDGATRLQRFKKITFPLLMVTVAPLLVGSFAFNFNNFTGIYLVTQGGPAIVGASTPAGATDILISYTFKLAFEGRGQDFGFASAISIIIFIIVAGFSWINFKLSGSFEEVSR
ncbi:MAG TPA: ABC transporter permease subunit, partial [Mesotoga sp.]|nr:ABC transporter permease subunit [Mesotoga sp.]